VVHDTKLVPVRFATINAEIQMALRPKAMVFCVSETGKNREYSQYPDLWVGLKKYRIYICVTTRFP
jgi:hypothetical protein